MNIKWEMIVAVAVGVLVANLVQPFVENFLPKG